MYHTYQSSERNLLIPHCFSVFKLCLSSFILRYPILVTQATKEKYIQNRVHQTTAAKRLYILKGFFFLFVSFPLQKTLRTRIQTGIQTIVAKCTS